MCLHHTVPAYKSTASKEIPNALPTFHWSSFLSLVRQNAAGKVYAKFLFTNNRLSDMKIQHEPKKPSKVCQPNMKLLKV